MNTAGDMDVCVCVLRCACVSCDFLSGSPAFEDLLEIKGLKKFMKTQLEDCEDLWKCLWAWCFSRHHSASENTRTFVHIQMDTHCTQFPWYINPQHQFHPSNSVQSIQYITTINIRDPHLLHSDASLLCSLLVSSMIQAQIEAPLKNTAWGEAKSYPVAERQKACQQQAVFSAHCCQCATLRHAAADQWQYITIETTWINTPLMPFVYSTFVLSYI